MTGSATGFGLGRPEVRLRLVLLLLGAALVSPNIYLPAGLPAVRLEQVILVLIAIPFALYIARHPEHRRLGLVDGAFLLLGGAILVSIVIAPLVVPVVGRSWHDIFDLARPFEYWVLYRIALTCDPSESAARSTLAVLFGVAIATALFSLIQFIGPATFNTTITAIWASSHNLDGVIRSHRVVGTSSSADVFAMLASLFGLAAFWAILLRRPATRLQLAVGAVCLVAGVMGLVLAVSRGATIAALAGLGLGAIVVLASRRRTRWHVALPLLGMSVLAAVALLFGLPKLVQVPEAPGQSPVARFNVGAMASDPSVVLRVERLRLLFSTGGQLPGTAGLCTTAADSGGSEDGSVAIGGVVGAPDGQAAMTAVQVRDAQRKHDVATIAAALDRAYCATGSWPASDPGPALAAAGLPSMPVDPSTGAPYSLVIDPTGYRVSATLEDPRDPDGPTYIATNQPNLVTNPSFELGDPTPSGWQVDPATTIAATPSDPRFGDHAAAAELSPAGYVYGYVVYTLSPSTDYSASIWMRSASGTDQGVRFYLTAILADGTRITPAAEARTTLSGSGAWVRVPLSFRTPSRGLVYTVQLIVQPWPTVDRASIAIDGAEFTATPEAPAFALTRQVAPSTLRSTVPTWLDSPLVGLGPLNNLQIGGDPGEYALMLINYGVFGIAGYLAIFAAAAWLLFRAWRRTDGWQSILAVTVLSATAVGAVFAATTATYLSYQLMAVYWLLVGLVLAGQSGRGARGQPRPAP